MFLPLDPNSLYFSLDIFAGQTLEPASFAYSDIFFLTDSNSLFIKSLNLVC